MNKSASTCIDNENAQPELPQDLQNENDHNVAGSPVPMSQMTTSTPQTPWAPTYQHLSQDLQEDGDFGRTSYTMPNYPLWPSGSNASSFGYHAPNYQLESSTMGQNCLTSFDETTGFSQPILSHGLQIAPHLHDPGRPRTFPVVDDLSALPQMHPSHSETVNPYELYHNGPPRSEPFSQGDSFEPYGVDTVYESVEDCTRHYPQMPLGYHDHSPGGGSYRSTPYEEDVSMDEEDSYDGEKHEPYAKSLYRCLKDAPNHTMVLRDIYEWFKENTARGKDPHEKGWQNSIRHNLSMNQAFEKVELTSPDEPPRKGFKWRLTELALRNGGVQSTTRFRNKQPNKRGSRTHLPAPQRQASGARGGRMARAAAEARRQEKVRESRNISHNLRSRGIIRSDVARATYSTMSMPPSPSHNFMTGVPSSFSSFDHDPPAASSYYPGLDQVYEYPQFQEYPMGPIDRRAMDVQSRPPYLATPEAPANTPARSPEIHWLPPSDRIFCDSSDTSTPIDTPGTSIYGDLDLNPMYMGAPEESAI